MDMKMLIDGQLVAGAGMLDVINPATEEVFARVPLATEAQLDKAVEAARKAQIDWAKTSMAERRAKVEALASAIGAHAEDLARTITQEKGKPLPEAAGEVEWSQGYLMHTAGLELPNRVIQDDEAFRMRHATSRLASSAPSSPGTFRFCWPAGRSAPR